jgi:hypothetical protein
MLLLLLILKLLCPAANILEFNKLPTLELEYEKLENEEFGDDGIIGGGVGVDAKILSILRISFSFIKPSEIFILAHDDDAALAATLLLLLHNLHLSAIELPNRSSRLFSSVDDTDEDSMLPLVSLTFVALLLLELMLAWLVLLLLLFILALFNVDDDVFEVIMVLANVFPDDVDPLDEDDEEEDDDADDEKSSLIFFLFCSESPAAAAAAAVAVSSVEFFRLDVVLCIQNVKHS